MKASPIFIGATTALLSLAACIGSPRPSASTTSSTSSSAGGQGAASGSSSGASVGGAGGGGLPDAGAGGGEASAPLRCDPGFTFSSDPISTSSVTVSYTNATGFVYIDLKVTGPGAPTASYAGVTGSPHVWSWSVSGYQPGVLSFTFVQGETAGNPGTPVASCQIAANVGGTPVDAGPDAPSSCSSGNLACSKIGAQVLGSTAPFTDFLSACPRVAKWMGTAGSPPPWAEMAAYKCACKGTTVLRMYGPSGNYATGQDLWDARYKTLEGAAPTELASLDYLESDNECDAGHCYMNGGAADYATFLSQWIDAAVAHGYRPLVLNMAVGNPPGDVSSCTAAGTATFGQLVPALVKAGQAGGGWGYHAYTPTWSEDAANYESYYALRYRRFVGCFPQLESVPLVLTEGGFDSGGNANSDGYLANGGAAQYFPWLSWLSGELAKDAYVKGITLFAFAPAGQWTSFRLDGDVAALKSTIGPATCGP